MDSPPIIFIHYGDSPYLKYTLKSARFFNPDKRIFLIGDSSNEKYRKFKIEHLFFDNYLESKSIDEFRRVYQRIGGDKFHEMNKRKGGQDWTFFNFAKWFVLFNFISEFGFEKCWTFDSDTLILSDLSSFELPLNSVDYTVMNSNHQLQGLLNNIHWLQKMQTVIIDSFRNQKYLEELIKNEFSKNPEWGFTMMRAFSLLKEQFGPNTLHLSSPIGDKIFDECVCHPVDEEVYKGKVNGFSIAKMFYDGKGRLYEKKSNQLVELWGINLSWVPFYYFGKIWNIISMKPEPDSTEMYQLIYFNEPYWIKFKSFLRKSIALFVKK